jgi:hypothetical protein
MHVHVCHEAASPYSSAYLDLFWSEEFTSVVLPSIRSSIQSEVFSLQNKSFTTFDGAPYLTNHPDAHTCCGA